MDNNECLTLVYIIEDYLERLRKANEEINCVYKHATDYLLSLKEEIESDTETESMEDKELYSVQIVIEPSNIGYNIRANNKEEAEEIATEYFYRDCGAYFNDLNHHIETFKFVLKEGGYELCKI